MDHTLHLDWWRREALAPISRNVAAPAPAGGRLGFGALVAFTVVLVLAPQQYLPVLGQLRIALVFAAIAVAAHVFGTSNRPSGSSVPGELKVALGLVACAVVSIPTSYWPSGSVTLLTDQYLKAIIVFWLLGQLVYTVGRLRSLLWTIATISVPLALVGVKDYLSGAFVQGRVAGYDSGLASNPNDLALTLNLFMPLAAALALTARRAWLRMLAWGIVGVNVAAVLVTFSRAGFLTLTAEGGLLFLVLVRRSAVKAAAGIVVCASLALLALPSGYAQRLSTIVDIESDPTNSAQERWRDTVNATKFVIAHPIVGAGVGQDVLALNSMRGASWTSVHNTYLKYGVDMGVPGLALFVALVVTSFRSARRVERSPEHVVGAELRTLASGIRISLAGFVVAAFFHPVPYHFYFYYISGLAVALKTIAARTSTTPAQP